MAASPRLPTSPRSRQRCCCSTPGWTRGSRARAASRLDGELIRAVDLIVTNPGKVVLTGIGKSGHIARKIAATLCSTGTASVFLHPAEAVHGDLGIYTPGDPTVFISKNGAS